MSACLVAHSFHDEILNFTGENKHWNECTCVERTNTEINVQAVRKTEGKLWRL